MTLRLCADNSEWRLYVHRDLSASGHGFRSIVLSSSSLLSSLFLSSEAPCMCINCPVKALYSPMQKQWENVSGRWSRDLFIMNLYYTSTSPRLRDAKSLFLGRRSRQQVLCTALYTREPIRALICYPNPAHSMVM